MRHAAAQSKRALRCVSPRRTHARASPWRWPLSHAACATCKGKHCTVRSQTYESVVSALTIVLRGSSASCSAVPLWQARCPRGARSEQSGVCACWWQTQHCTVRATQAAVFARTFFVATSNSMPYATLLVQLCGRMGSGGACGAYFPRASARQMRARTAALDVRHQAAATACRAPSYANNDEHIV